MSDYFDRVEQGLREAVRRRAHAPWYARFAARTPRPSRSSRPLAVVVVCLVAAGSALAATGAFRTGRAVLPGAPVAPNTNEGVAIPSSVHLLALRVADPDGGPPWVLRELKTTRGLICLQLGRLVDGQIGALGQDGAFADDGRFHPLSVNFLTGGAFPCGTEDARGHAFANEQDTAIPASGLLAAEHDVSGGCYRQPQAPPACPRGDLRDVYYGLLGPDALRVTHLTPSGGLETTPTTGEDGAYLVVLPHRALCTRGQPYCQGGEAHESGGPELHPSGVIRAVHYRDAPACQLPTPARLALERSAQAVTLRAALRAQFPTIYRALYRDERYVRGTANRLTPRQNAQLEALRAPFRRAEQVSCPEVGYTPPASPRITHAEVATPISARAEPAKSYCERQGQLQPCDEHRLPDGKLPRGYRRLPTIPGHSELLVLVSFTARVAVSNFDRHYEIQTVDPSNHGNRQCPGAGGGTFGPTDTDLRAGARVHFAQFFNQRCPGIYKITVGLVSTDAPSGDIPVPGQPGESAEIPVGVVNFRVR